MAAKRHGSNSEITPPAGALGLMLTRPAEAAGAPPGTKRSPGDDKRGAARHALTRQRLRAQAQAALEGHDGPGSA